MSPSLMCTVTMVTGRLQVSFWSVSRLVKRSPFTYLKQIVLVDTQCLTSLQ